MPRLVIEVCVDSVDSAIAAVRGGADRLELCGNLGVGGGTTPSMGLLKAVQRAAPDTPIMAMVRPRVGDFLYSQAELEVMLEDIRLFKEAGVAGVVFGVLALSGKVDVENTKKLVQQALPIQVTFHRAVDMTIDYNKALQSIAKIHGITRVLTSGHSKSITLALQASEIFNLARNYFNRPGFLLFGSGINPATIDSVVDQHVNLRLREIHLTGGRWNDGGMWHRPEGMGMGAPGHEWGVWSTSEDTVKAVRAYSDEQVR